MAPTIYNGSVREREAIEDIDLIANKVDVIADNVSNKLYTDKFGDFIKDIDEVVSRLAPEGLHKQLEFMRDYRKSRPYEQQLQTELDNFFSRRPHGDILMLTELALSSLKGDLSTGYRGTGKLDLLKITPYRKLEVAILYEEYGYRGVVLVLKYYIDFWYVI
ncbi:MAG: hypothetical protein DRP93_03120 [Candidatus Neomarinimicrobiota bacterium]|nr:MAG: hypothetical protein DRP93_03120 [Candidatus Neomarinimicrobiota bacterium]